MKRDGAAILASVLITVWVVSARDTRGPYRHVLMRHSTDRIVRAGADVMFDAEFRASASIESVIRRRLILKGAIVP